MSHSAVPTVVDHHNEVRLVGRVAAEPVVSVMPSGDEVVTARLVVDRPRPPAGRGRMSGVDTIACAAWSPEVRRVVRVWRQGDIVEVTGSLRRRFWRSPEGARSRFEIEVATASRLVRAPDAPVNPPADA